MSVRLRRLNLGCGSDIRQGYVNLDRVSLPGVDVAHDLEKLPLPFEDGSFDEILCQDVLEHLDYVPLMRELHRILVPGGTLVIRVPHFTAVNNFIDPSHKKMFSFRTFEYFVPNCPYSREYYYDFQFTCIKNIRITLPTKTYVYNYLVEPFININNATRRLYEGTFLSRLFPAENVIVEIQK